MTDINLDIDLDSLLKDIETYEPDIIKRVDHFVDLYDKKEKEDYIWRCVDLLRDEKFVDGVDVIHNYVQPLLYEEKGSLLYDYSFDFMWNVMQVIYGTDDFDTDDVNGHFYGSCKEYDKKKVEALFDKHGDTLIKLTHTMLLELFWWDDIENQFKNGIVKGERLKKDAENFITHFEEFPDKHLSDIDSIKIGPDDYYEVKVNGYIINDIRDKDLGYKNRYGFTIDFGYNDFTFTHQVKSL